MESVMLEIHDWSNARQSMRACSLLLNKDGNKGIFEMDNFSR